MEGSFAVDILVGAVGTAQTDRLEGLGCYSPVEGLHDAQVDSPEIADTVEGHSLDETVRDVRIDSLEVVGIVAPGDLGILVLAPLGIDCSSGTAVGCRILAARALVHHSHLGEGQDDGRLGVPVVEAGILLPSACSQSVIRHSHFRFRYRPEH